MKFDVVVGNPPYRDPLSNNTIKLWPKFVDISVHRLTTYNGYISMVTPRTWVTNDMLEKYFLANMPVFINIDECARYFPGVNSTFSYWIIQNKTMPPEGGSVVIISMHRPKGFKLNRIPVCGIGSGNPIAMGIIEKMTVDREFFNNFSSYKFGTNGFSRNTSSLSKVKTSTHTHPVLHKRSAAGVDTYFYANFKDDNQCGVPRVILSLWVGRWKDMFTSQDIQTCEQFIQFKVEDLTQAENLKNVLTTKIYTFMMKELVSGGSLTIKSTSRFPKIDLTRSWTDAELYEHFNLTQEEIDLVEKTIK